MTRYTINIQMLGWGFWCFGKERNTSNTSKIKDYGGNYNSVQIEEDYKENWSYQVIKVQQKVKYNKNAYIGELRVETT